MAVSQVSLIDSAREHIHIAEEVCPWCEQPIPHEKFAEISSRIEARESERLAEITAGLQEQFAREKAEAEGKIRADLEQLRRDGLAALEKLRAESAASVAAAHVEGKKEAEAAAQERLAEAERERKESEIALQAKVAEAEQAKNVADQLGVDLNSQLEQVRNENAQTIETLKLDSAAKEAAARAEGRQVAEAAMQEQLTEAERLKAEAIGDMQVKVAEADQAKQTVAQELDQFKQRHETVVNARVQEVREALEKDKIDALNVEKAKAFEENIKLQGKVQDLQRQLDNKSTEELGEGAEVDLYEALKGEFPEDRISRVCKGAPGADIIHVVIHNGRDCGTIIYDSKNRNAWRSDYVTKLAEDQMAAKAEHAVLSTHKFPAGARQLCVQDGVIIANPGRVVALVQVLRKHIIQGHTLRLSNEARSQKTAALYDFITSERCLHLFERIDTHTEDLLDIQVKEKKAHDANWRRQGELIRSVQRVRAEMSSEIDRIIGTASAGDGTP
jgi:Uncharacterized protein conserved in bacteria (DUF2130)